MTLTTYPVILIYGLNTKTVMKPRALAQRNEFFPKVNSQVFRFTHEQEIFGSMHFLTLIIPPNPTLPILMTKYGI